MARLERKENGWMLGDTLVKAVYNIDDIKARGVHTYADNPEYADYFLTTDEWRLRAKVCRITYAPQNPNKWHLQTHGNSDSAFYIMSGEGEALVGPDKWSAIRPGDLYYANAGQPFGIRVTKAGDEVWYVHVAGPGPVSVGDLQGKLCDVVGNGAPAGREH